MKIRKVLAAYLKAMVSTPGVSRSIRYQSRFYVKSFGAAFGRKSVEDVGHADLERWLAAIGWKASSQKNARQFIRRIFRWAELEAGLIAESPFWNPERLLRRGPGKPRPRETPEMAFEHPKPRGAVPEPPASPVTVSEVFTAYVATFDTFGDKRKQLLRDVAMVATFLTLFGDKRVADSGPPDVEAWLQGSGWTKTSQAVRLSVLRRIFRWAEEAGVIAKSPYW